MPTTAQDTTRVEFETNGLVTRYLMRGEETGGRFAVLEHDLPPRTLAAPTHVHEHEDEYSYVLSGRLGVMVGDEVTEAGPGTLVAKPRGIPHAFWNAGNEETRIIELVSPAGFESFFEEAAPYLAGAEPDFERVGAIQAGYGLEMDFSSIEPLMKRHGLRLA